MELAKIFKDNMVIQRDKPFHIWGIGEEYEKIVITIDDIRVYTEVKDGKWKAEMPAMETTLETKIIIESEKETKIINNVAIGEVWIAAGQSNMEFWMKYDLDFQTQREVCSNKLIRFFDYPEVSYQNQETDFDYSKVGIWRKCDEDNLEYYSAVAYYFSKKLKGELNVPIGIIGCNWGGTTASSWMSSEYLKKHGQVWIDEYENAIKELDIEEYKRKYRKNIMNNRGEGINNKFTECMLRGLSREKQLELIAQPFDDSINEYFVLGPYSEKRPGILYEMMVKEIAPYGVRGVIWYQGESDVLHANIYEKVLSDLIDCWRDLWNERLPFICVQLAPFEEWLSNGGELFPIIRRAQENVSKIKDSVYMISSSDAGERYDIHPKNKKPIGDRLAINALGNIYDKDILCEAPTLESINIYENSIKINLKNCTGGLELRGEEVNNLKIFGLDGDRKVDIIVNNQNIEVENESIIIYIVENKRYDVYKIEFAMTPYYKVNIYNREGIPAIPFEKKIKI